MTRTRMLRRAVDTIHHAWCSDCDYTTTGPRARRRAADHARDHGHRVRLTQTSVSEYAPAQPRPGRDLSQPIERSF